MTTRTNTAVPAATALGATTTPGAPLGEQGFSPREAAALCALRRRYERGELNEISIDHKRLAFARWLVQYGRLNEYPGGIHGAGQ